MSTLEQAQANFMNTINNGPDVLDNKLFSGPIDRVLLGLKAHANTINHARLVAMEQSFPRTVAQIGLAAFNNVARDYVQTDAARKSDNNAIGTQFPEFLQSQYGVTPLANLARIEWAWLQSYHATDRAALKLADITSFSETGLLAMRIAWHPATRVIALNGAMPEGLPELADEKNVDAVLIVRPDAEVRLLSLDSLTAIIALAAEKSTTIGNLLTLSSEQGDETDPVGPVLILIGAGALVAVE